MVASSLIRRKPGDRVKTATDPARERGDNRLGLEFQRGPEVIVDAIQFPLAESARSV